MGRGVSLAGRKMYAPDAWEEPFSCSIQNVVCEKEGEEEVERGKRLIVSSESTGSCVGTSGRNNYQQAE